MLRTACLGVSRRMRPIFGEINRCRTSILHAPNPSGFLHIWCIVSSSTLYQKWKKKTSRRWWWWWWRWRKKITGKKNGFETRTVVRFPSAIDFDIWLEKFTIFEILLSRDMRKLFFFNSIIFFYMRWKQIEFPRVDHLIPFPGGVLDKQTQGCHIWVSCEA